jgi:hypothetical protein
MFGVDWDQNPFIWIVKLPMSGKPDHRTQSADHARRVGMEQWVQVTWDKSKSIYVPDAASGTDLDEPIWPNKTKQEWLDSAFAGERFIKDAKHEQIRRVLGLEF